MVILTVTPDTAHFMRIADAIFNRIMDTAILPPVDEDEIAPVGP